MSVSAALLLGCFASRLVLIVAKTGGVKDVGINTMVSAFEKEMETMRLTPGSNNDDEYVYALVARLETCLAECLAIPH